MKFTNGTATTTDANAAERCRQAGMAVREGSVDPSVTAFLSKSWQKW
ncbi:hypothetical protein [Humisphaera borealis]|nr:hypothetical protein [Humisphaera borealis]